MKKKFPIFIVPSSHLIAQLLYCFYPAKNQLPSSPPLPQTPRRSETAHAEKTESQGTIDDTKKERKFESIKKRTNEIL